MRSPIKYYGGKSYMTDIILENFPSEYEIYVEGFGGGASVLFSKPQCGIEVYNDLSLGVYSLFKVLSDDALFEKLKHKMDISVYSRKLHDEYKNSFTVDMDIVERAFRYLYVNRSSFNGVGGFSVSKYLRRNMCKSASDWLSMIDGLPEVHNRLSSVVVENLDIFDLIDKYDGENVFMYLDPPYVHSTRKSSQKYDVEMSDEQHVKLLSALKHCKCKFLLSGYDNKLYDESGFNKISFVRPNSHDVETLWKNY